MNNKSGWDKTVDVLRLATPVFIGILGYLFLGFQSTLEKNTEAVNDIRTQMAVMVEKSKTFELTISSLSARVESNSRELSDVKSRVILIESRERK